MSLEVVPIKFVFMNIALPKFDEAVTEPTEWIMAEGVVVPNPTFPELDTNMNVLEPEVTVNDPGPVDTEADTLPTAIWDKFKPVIPDAGILVKPEPFP
jgi:hypothetical protein